MCILAVAKKQLFVTQIMEKNKNELFLLEKSDYIDFIRLQNMSIKMWVSFSKLDCLTPRAKIGASTSGRIGPEHLYHGMEEDHKCHPNRTPEKKED